jgi:hypothetical protein
MFKEIAIDPAAVVTSATQFNNIIDRFGISEGRLIAAFPSKWKKLVYDAAKAEHKHAAKHIDLKSIEDRLTRLPKSIFLSRERPGDGCTSDWTTAAIIEHRRFPFDAVIASVEIGEEGFLLPTDVSKDHPSFKPNREWPVKRDANSMADCCSSLLGGSYHIKLVDYKFDASKLRWKRPFTEFLRRIKPGSTIDIFRDDDILTANYVTGVEDSLKEVAQIGATLRLFTRPKGSMHRRFVLNDTGGVSFDIGLDEDFGGQKTHDTVTVLQEDTWLEQWEKYAGDDYLFKLEI